MEYVVRLGYWVKILLLLKVAGVKWLENIKISLSLWGIKIIQFAMELCSVYLKLFKVVVSSAV